MSGASGWKIATFVLAATSLALTGVLVARPTPITQTTTTESRNPPQEAGAVQPERRHVEPAQAVDPEQDVTVAAQNAAEHVAALGAMTTEDVCRRYLLIFDGLSRSEGPAMGQIVARLRQDPQRATEILEDWLRRRDEIREAGLTGSARALVSLTYVRLRGAEAAPLLREIVLEQRDWDHLPALIRTGDSVSLQDLDAYQRSLAEGMISPYRVTSGGPHGIELIRGWAFDEEVREALRSESRKCLWSFGTDADRERLLRVASPEQIVRDFSHVLAFDKTAHEDWKARMRGLAIAALDAEDPWVRLLAVKRTLRHVSWSGDPWPADLIARAADAGRLLVQLPAPGGRDPKQWTELRRDVASTLDELDGRPAHERRVREVLGFEEPERTDTE